MPGDGVKKRTASGSRLDGVADRIIIVSIVFSMIPIFAMFNASINFVINGFLYGRVGQGLSGVGSYMPLIKHAGYINYIKNSLLVSGIGIGISLALALPASYALARYKFKGVNMFGILVVMPLLIPTIAYFLPFAVTMKRFEEISGIKFYNSYNGYIVLGIMYAVMYLPFSIWVLRGFMVSIPQEIEEAARVDGCSTVGVLLRMLLPLMRSGIVVTALLLLMLVWDERMLVDVLMTKDEFKTVALWPSTDNLRFISAPLSTLPIFIVFSFLHKNFMKGITGGTLKE